MPFRLLYWLVRIALLPLVVPVVLWRRLSRRRYFLTFEVDGKLTDVAGKGGPPWSRRRGIDLETLRDAAVLLSTDRHVVGVRLDLKSFEGGWATAVSMRTVLSKMKAAGKAVVVYLPRGADSKSLYVATAGTHVFAAPLGTIGPLGVASRAFYIRSALDRLGASAEVLACGAYKSAAETLVRDTMSDAQREQVGRLIDQFYAELRDGLASGRNKGLEDATRFIDEAPHLSEAARDLGFVDEVFHEDEVDAWVRDTFSDPRPCDVFAWVRRKRARLLPRLRRPLRVGIVTLHGPITGDQPFLPSRSDRTVGAVRRARSDRRVGGVIIHIDSPGGSAFESERIFHEVKALASEKPVVAFFSDVAASGGYYVGAAASHIAATPTTVTGSIGVVSVRPNFGAVLGRLGVKSETEHRGENSGMLDMSRPLSESERRSLRRELDGIYDAFRGVVATSRKMTPEAVLAVAEGRVFSGTDAMHNGLVDSLGGFDGAKDAIAKMLDRHAVDCDFVRIKPPRSVPRSRAATAKNTPIDRAVWLFRDAAETLGVWPSSVTTPSALTWCPTAEFLSR